MAYESAAELDLTTSMLPRSQKVFVWQVEGKEIKNKPVVSTGGRLSQCFLNKDWERAKLSSSSANEKCVAMYLNYLPGCNASGVALWSSKEKQSGSRGSDCWRVCPGWCWVSLSLRGLCSYNLVRFDLNNLGLTKSRISLLQSAVVTGWNSTIALLSVALFGLSLWGSFCHWIGNSRKLLFSHT